MKSDILNIEKLSVKYIGQKELVIQNVSLKLSLGERVAIWGPSGCGKTTLISLINSVLTSKDVVAKYKSLSLNKEIRIATVFQTPRLLPWLSVKENILYPLSNIKEQHANSLLNSEEILKKIQLDKYSTYYPSELSVGMGQRINMARALVYKPELIILDEPFSSLDKKSKNIMKSELRDYLNTNKSACILISHDIRDVYELCNSVMVFTEGPATLKKTLKVEDYKNKEALEKAIYE